MTPATGSGRREPRLCIVGAGLAGAGVADALRDVPIDVTVLEKSRGVGGRAATRRRHGCRYDHGANYVKGVDERTTDLLRGLGADGLTTIDGPVWTFDADGDVVPGDRQEEKWTWAAGITQFAKRVFARTDATVETETRAAAIDNDADDWYLTDGDGDTHGPFDALVLTPPAPQTASLLTETGWTDGELVALREAVGAVPYRSVRSVVLHYPFELDVPWYALVNADKAHDVGWVGREEAKPGRVPDGESLLVVQMAPEWSGARFDESLEAVAPSVAKAVADLLGDERLSEPDWTDGQGWRYALPDSGAARSILERSEDAGLFFAGDWVVGEGRVHAAFWNGVETGERFLTRFS